MGMRAARFTQAEIARAIRAIEETGASMAVEIARDGTIKIVPVGKPKFEGPREEEPTEVELL